MTGVLAFLLAGCGNKDQQEADAIKALVRAEMKDPEATRFTKLKMRLGNLCGEVNSKNSFGAYAGAEKFTAFRGGVSLRSKREYVDALQVAANQPTTHFAEAFDKEWEQCQREGKPVA